MPVESETSTGDSNVTVAVENPVGPGGSTELVDIVITVEPGKVVPKSEPVGYTKYDPDNLSVWWHNVSIIPNDEVAKTFEVKRLDGPQYSGAVEVTTIVTNKNGTYFKVQRRCLCEQSTSPLVLAGLLARLRKAFFSILEEYERPAE